MYSQDNPAGGGVPLEFHFDLSGCRLDGPAKTNKAYTKAYDDILEVDEHYYSGTVVFTRKSSLSPKKWTVRLEIGGQACNDSGCLRVIGSHTFTGTSPLGRNEGRGKKAERGPKGQHGQRHHRNDRLRCRARRGFMTPGANMSGVNADKWWANVEAEMRVFEDAPTSRAAASGTYSPSRFPWRSHRTCHLRVADDPDDRKLLPQRATRAAAKLSRRPSSTEPRSFVIYVALGLIVTAIFGASALNELATSAGFNVAFFLLLVVFAISFGGRLRNHTPRKNGPTRWTPRWTAPPAIFRSSSWRSRLCSYPSPAPARSSVRSSWKQPQASNFISPAIGMFGFALALAIPFSLFAIFPTMLKSMPKGGGWMNTVKVVLRIPRGWLLPSSSSPSPTFAYGWRILDREGVRIALDRDLRTPRLLPPRQTPTSARRQSGESRSDTLSLA